MVKETGEASSRQEQCIHVVRTLDANDVLVLGLRIDTERQEKLLQQPRHKDGVSTQVVRYDVTQEQSVGIDSLGLLARQCWLQGRQNFFVAFSLNWWCSGYVLRDVTAASFPTIDAQRRSLSSLQTQKSAQVVVVIVIMVVMRMPKTISRLKGDE